MTKTVCTITCLLAALLLAGCGRSNNLLLGRVEAQVGAHRVVVTDCYRLSVPPPGRSGDGGYRFTPCVDADIRIELSGLVVNGRSYGAIGPADDILVDHGRVSVRSQGGVR
ncbi:MAG: hypothetical protein WBL61_03680 [Bryobacteraceae bacterium]